MPFPGDELGPPAAGAAECSEEMKELLRAGVVAARGGQHARARELLTRVVQQDEHNLPAWLWLSEVVEGTEEREVCLENVLTLDPGNEIARQALARLRQQAQAPAAVPAGTALPTAGAAPGDVVEPAVPGAPAAPLAAGPDYGQEYGCPYCAAPTAPQDRRCPACGGKLWVRSRQQEEHASKIGLVLVLQALGAGLNLATAGVILAYVAGRLGRGDAPTLLQIFLGLPSVAPPEMAEQALQIAPRPVFFALLFFALLSLVALVGTYLRWKPALYLVLVNGAWLVVAGVLTTLLLWQTAGGEDPTRTTTVKIAIVALDVLILLVVLGLGLEVRPDFFVEQKRLYLRLDSGAVAGADFLAHGQRYMREEMWALAAIHLQRGVEQMPDAFPSRLQLALALGELKQYDAAARRLEEARQIRPQDPRIAELEGWLKRKRGAPVGAPRVVDR